MLPHDLVHALHPHLVHPGIIKNGIFLDHDAWLEEDGEELGAVVGEVHLSCQPFGLDNQDIV